MSENTNATYQINSWFKHTQQKISLVRNNIRDLSSMKMLHVGEGSYLGEIVGAIQRCHCVMTISDFSAVQAMIRLLISML